MSDNGRKTSIPWRDLAHNHPDLEIEVVTVTPDKAIEWLERNRDDNRAVSDRHVAKLSEDMRVGEWAVDGSPIRFDTDGKLIDGQHRLYACIESGKPFTTVVIRGLGPQAIDTIDAGKERTASDVLSRYKVQRHGTAATIASTVAQWEKGELAEAGTSVSRRETLQTFDKYPGIEEWTIWAGRFTGVVSRPTTAASLTFIFSITDPDAGEGFAHDLWKGAGLGEDDPVRRLRDKLMQDRNSKEKLTRKDWLALIIKTWNYRAEHRTVSRLVWYPKEDFPVIVEPVKA